MTRITPSQFKEAFLKVVLPLESQFAALWNNRRGYSTLMFNDAFPPIATNLNISVYNGDYYYLDSVFYDERDVEHFGETATYVKCISIAMEHEHDYSGTAVEINKLQLFNSPLKVLITYVQTPELRDYCLSRFTKILRGADIFDDFATLRRQLVIFGSISGVTITWHFYAYEADGFREIPERSINFAVQQ